MNNQYYPNMVTNQNNYLSSNHRQTKQVIVPEVFIETNMYLNLGEYGKFHMSFPDSEKERDVIFEGKIVEAARDHIVIHNIKTNHWYMLPLLYLNYTEFDDKPVLFPSNNT